MGEERLAEVVMPAHWKSSMMLAEDALQKAISEAGISKNDIQYSVATGAGKNRMPFACEVAFEVESLMTGLKILMPSVRSVLDVGEGSSLAVSFSDKVTIARSDGCAGGAGMYLEVISDVLGIPIKQMGDLAMQSTNPVEVNTTCAVFAESEIISLVHAKTKVEDILRGCCEGLARHLIPLLLQVRFKESVAMVGGVSKNICVRKALERQLGCTVRVPENPLILTALGAAAIAAEKLKAKACSSPA